MLPARQKLTRGHHAAVGYKELPAIIKRLRAAAGVSARAVEFAALTAARSGEVRGAVWPEIDLDAALWTVPAAKMKAARDHEVPLSERAVTILRATQQQSTSDLVFASKELRSFNLNLIPAAPTVRPLFSRTP